ncbi:glycine oxidase ThiO [Gynuella sp.]|uniref:glycine oxidase ThiO n=1 Tax=Gynuella sp. TaxID=2969146 RepID=UPI003D0B7885
MNHIAIVGAGLIGRAMAWQLLQTGQRVTLFDRDRIDGDEAAAYTAGGMISPLSEIEVLEPALLQLARQSLQLWPALVDSLGQEVDFHNHGSLIISHPQDSTAHQRFLKQLQQHTHPTAEEYAWLNASQLRQQEPELLPNFQQAVLLPEESWVDPARLMPALAERILPLCEHWHSGCEVTAIEPHTVSCGLDSHRFDLVVDCRGMGAQKDLPGLRGVRGEVARFHAPEVRLTHLIRLMHPRYCLYIVPRAGQRYLIGATQIESEDRGPVSVRSALELLSAVYSLHKGFAEARIEAFKTNLRPAMPDNQPLLSLQSGLMRINGLFRHGFMLAPAITAQALQQLQQQGYL